MYCLCASNDIMYLLLVKCNVTRYFMIYVIWDRMGASERVGCDLNFI
jgi:hypothetical protein